MSNQIVCRGPVKSNTHHQYNPSNTCVMPSLWSALTFTASSRDPKKRCGKISAGPELVGSMCERFNLNKLWRSWGQHSAGSRRHNMYANVCTYFTSSNQQWLQSVPTQHTAGTKWDILGENDNGSPQKYSYYTQLRNLENYTPQYPPFGYATSLCLLLKP